MTLLINAVVPLFALILLGFIAGRQRLLGTAAVDCLNKFVVWMALPALLFQAMAKIQWHELNQPGYLAGFSLAIGIVFVLSCLTERRRAVSLADRSIEALASSYANAGFMGFPLCLMLFGPESLPAVVMATLLTACVLFAVTLVLIEWDLQGSNQLRSTLRKVSLSVLRNPLVAAPLAGLCIALPGWEIPMALDTFLSLLSAAASPCALVTIGLFLAQGTTTQRTPAVVWRIVLFKLVIHPALTYVMVFHIFSVPPLWASIAVILAALPVGTGPFMLAKLYDRAPAITSQAILISTLISLITVSLAIHWLQPI